MSDEIQMYHRVYQILSVEFICTDLLNSLSRWEGAHHMLLHKYTSQLTSKGGMGGLMEKKQMNFTIFDA